MNYQIYSKSFSSTFHQKSASGITMNNIPMVCRKAEPEPTDDSQFVYDLYYTHSSLADLDLHAALTVEALCDAALVNEQDEEDGEEGRFVHEESDDSNDENNWRNDYPDEDPHFFENADYDYAEGEIRIAFSTYSLTLSSYHSKCLFISIDFCLPSSSSYSAWPTLDFFPHGSY